MFYGQTASAMWDQKLEENLDVEKFNRLRLQRNRIAGSIDVESILPPGHYPLRPPIVTNSRYERIQSDFLKLAELCERVSFLVSEFNLPTLSQRLGHGNYRPGSYASTHPLSFGLAQREIRPDFIVSNDQVKVLEMNFGAMTGGHPEVAMEALLYLDHEIPY